MSYSFPPSPRIHSVRLLVGMLVLSLIFTPLPARTEEQPLPGTDAPGFLALEMEECVQVGLDRNPRIKAAEYAVQRAGSDVQASFADFLPRVDASFQARRLRQVRSGRPSAENATEETNDVEHSEDLDAASGAVASEGTRLLEQSLAKANSRSQAASSRRAATSPSASRLARDSKNDPSDPAPGPAPGPVPGPAPSPFNPFEDLQQQLDQINQGLTQQNQSLSSLDANLSEINENLGDLDGDLEDLNVQLEELQEALDRRPIDADSTTFDETVWSLRVSQPVFTGFTITNTYLRSRLSREITEAELEHMRLEVARDIRLAFLNVLWAEEDMHSLEARVTRLEAQLDAADAFARLGMKPYLDVLQADVDLSEARQEYLQVQNARRVHTARLLTLMGLPTDTPIEILGRLEAFQADFGLSLRECWTQARANRPDLFIAHKAVEVAEKDVHLAWGRFAPTATVDFAYNIQDRDYEDSEIAERFDYSNRQFWTLGLNISLNLFEGGRSRAMVLRARHELFRIREEMLHHEMQAAYEVESAFLVLHEAQERIESTVKVRAAAEEAYDMALVRYRTEIGTQAELLDAQERLARAETNTNQARAQYNRARAQLYYAMGWLEAKT